MSDERILIIEDDLGLLKAYVRNLSAPEYEVDATHEIEEARELTSQTEYAVILTDLKLHTSDEGGLEILTEVKQMHPDTQVIIFSGVGDTQAVIRAFRLNADGYLPKPLDFQRVREQIVNSINVYRWQKSIRENPTPAPTVPTRLDLQTPEPFYFYAETMSQLVRRATRLYRTSENILITGEPGTGKSLIAEGIHRGSGRKDFELLNCAGLSDVTLEPLLFGTAASDGTIRTGLLERLQNGTLVLDRVSGIGLSLQKRLLETLTTGVVQTVPGMESVPINVRIISIDEGYLEDDVRQKLFLPELYNLLSRAHLHVPPLRERYDAKYRDALILAQQLITQKYNSSCHLNPESEYIFEHYPFPGNVSELDRVVRQALGLAGEDQVILPENLPARMLRYGIRPGLGEVEVTMRILCPHGPFACDRTSTIATAYRSLTGVYLRLQESFPAKAFSSLEQRLRQLGMMPLEMESVPNAKTPMCSSCIPAQSCHYAIVDISQTDPEALYDIGVLHALGTPVLLLCEQDISLSLRHEQVIRYATPDDLVQKAYTWLREFSR